MQSEGSRCREKASGSSASRIVTLLFSPPPLGAREPLTEESIRVSLVPSSVLSMQIQSNVSPLTPHHPPQPGFHRHATAYAARHLQWTRNSKEQTTECRPSWRRFGAIRDQSINWIKPKLDHWSNNNRGLGACLRPGQ